MPGEILGSTLCPAKESSVREDGKTYKQDASARHTSKKQGPGIQASCTIRTNINNDTNTINPNDNNHYHNFHNCHDHDNYNHNNDYNNQSMYKA